MAEDCARTDSLRRADLIKKKKKCAIKGEDYDYTGNK